VRISTLIIIASLVATRIVAASCHLHVTFLSQSSPLASGPASAISSRPRNIGLLIR
jgi:hypothetical protein